MLYASPVSTLQQSVVLCCWKDWHPSVGGILWGMPICRYWLRCISIVSLCVGYAASCREEKKFSLFGGLAGECWNAVCTQSHARAHFMVLWQRVPCHQCQAKVTQWIFSFSPQSCLLYQALHHEFWRSAKVKWRVTLHPSPPGAMLHGMEINQAWHHLP